MSAPYVGGQLSAGPSNDGHREQAPGQDIKEVVVGGCEDG
jgi:hypothetical protein